MTRRHLVTLALVAASIAAAAAVVVVRDGSSHDKTIVAAATRALEPDWRWTPDPPHEPGQPGQSASLFATPVVWRGRAFLGSNEGDFYSVDVAKGRTLWRRHLGWQPKLSCFEPAGIASTAAVRDGGGGKPLVYVNAPDGFLYQLDGDSGKTLWRSIVAIPSRTANDYFAWSSPRLGSAARLVDIPCVAQRATEGCSPCPRGSRLSSSVMSSPSPAGVI